MTSTAPWRSSTAPRRARPVRSRGWCWPNVATPRIGIRRRRWPMLSSPLPRACGVRKRTAPKEIIEMSKTFASTGDTAEKKITFSEIGRDLYAFTAEGDPNSGVIIGDDGVIVIDAQATHAMAGHTHQTL